MLIPSFLYPLKAYLFCQAQPSTSLPEYDNWSRTVWVFRYQPQEFQLLLRAPGLPNDTPVAQVFHFPSCFLALDAALLLWLILSFGSLSEVSVDSQSAWASCILRCYFVRCNRLFELSFLKIIKSIHPLNLCNLESEASLEPILVKLPVSLLTCFFWQLSFVLIIHAYQLSLSCSFVLLVQRILACLGVGLLEVSALGDFNVMLVQCQGIF